MNNPPETARINTQNLLDFLAILRVLRARTRFIFLTSLLFTLISIAITLMLTPVFTATTAVLIDPTIKQPLDLNQQSRSALTESIRIDSQVAMLRSDTILRPVVRSEKLIDDTEFGSGVSSGLAGLLLEVLRPTTSSRESSQQDSENKALKALADATTVKRDGQTFILSISVDSKNPSKAARLSLAIANSFLSDQKRQLEQASNQVTSQIEDRLVGLRERLRLAEDNVQEFRAENNLQVGAEGGLITEQALAGINSSLIEARGALAAAEAKNTEIQRLLRQGADAESISDAINSPTIAQLREQHSEAARNVANLSAALLPSHPSLIMARSQLAEVQQLIRDEVVRIGDSSKISLKVARDRVNNLEADLESARSLNNVDSTARIRLRELETEAIATRTLYENALAKAKQISALDQVVVPDARVISPAVAPESPTWPKKKLIVVLAAVLGLLIGCCAAIGGTALRLLKARLANKYEALAFNSASPTRMAISERQLGLANEQAGTEPPRRVAKHIDQRLDTAAPLSILGRIPRMIDPKALRSGVARQSEEVDNVRHALDLFYYEEVDGQDAEFGRAIEKIQERIDQLAEETDARVALITAPDTNQGQTMLAFAVAFSGACRGLKVLLVDADPLQKGLTRDLDGVAARRRQTLHERVSEDPELGISFVSLIAGQSRYKPFELSGKATRELAHITRNYDLTVIDGPLLHDLSSDTPLLAVSDLLLVALAEESERAASSQELAARLNKLAGDRPHALLMTGS